MKRLLLFVVLTIGAVHPATVGATPEQTKAGYAVVRITSHKASGVIIHSDEKVSYILTAAHLFFHIDRDEIDKNLLTKPIVFDCPWPTQKKRTKVSPKVKAIDAKRDLALIEFSWGPMPYVAGVAPPLTSIEKYVSSFGHDMMRIPSVHTPVRIVEIRGDTIYTFERPIGGRSGGPLINKGGYIVGICQGYMTVPPFLGLYVSHQAILSFLREQGLVSSPRREFYEEPPGRSKPPPKPLPNKSLYIVEEIIDDRNLRKK